MFSQIPLYNLSAVLRETGANADVLRAWERRYHLPHPQRTAGGQRLYSEYDIETIKWLRSRQAEGITISRAVELWSELSVKGDPLARELRSNQPLISTDSLTADLIDDIRESWVQACLAFDTIKADATISQAFGIFPVETVCTRVLQQGLREIGERWHLGTITVQQEHFASTLAQNRIQSLISSTPTPIFEQTILIGCPAGEQHTIPTLLLNLFLRREGYRVVNLGADVPTAQLAETTRNINPELVVLSAQRLETASTLATTSRILSTNRIQVAFGGLIFTRIPLLIKKISGHYLGDSIESSVEVIKKLVVHPEPVIAAEDLPQKTKQLSILFTENRALIEHDVTRAIQEGRLSIDNLAEVNSFFGDELSAALELGDISFLELDLDWVTQLLQGHFRESNLLPSYLLTYKRIVQNQLGSDGSSIINWIENYNIIHEHKE